MICVQQRKISSIQRIRQFISALTAKVEPEERKLVNRYLDKSEQQLFYRMSVVDQRHALDVCFLVMEALAGRDDYAEHNVVIKAALLHDVGKLAGELTLFDRSLIVILELLLPQKMADWACEGRGSFIANCRHALYVALHHAERGAEDLLKIGTPREIVELVKGHHQVEITTWQMEILQDADSKA